MNVLTSGQIADLTKLMDERFAREMDDIRAAAVRARDQRGQAALAGYPADELDRVLLDTASSTDYALVRKDVEDLRDIVAARRRLATGDYGTCADCDQPIGYERLLAHPTAKRCIGCQREHEWRHTGREVRRAY